MFGRLFGKSKMTFAEATVALNAAVRAGDTEQIRKLARTYPKVLETPDASGACPLHWAAKSQSLDSVACLVDLGADVTKKDGFGYTAEQVAYWNGEYRMGAYTDVCLKIVERLKQGAIAKR